MDDHAEHDRIGLPEITHGFAYGAGPFRSTQVVRQHYDRPPAIAVRQAQELLCRVFETSLNGTTVGAKLEFPVEHLISDAPFGVAQVTGKVRDQIGPAIPRVPAKRHDGGAIARA